MNDQAHIPTAEELADSFRPEDREKTMADRSCGGCEGLGSHSPRCTTQPGWHFQRLMDMADSLGDRIGANDMESANAAYRIAGRMRARRDEERARNG